MKLVAFHQSDLPVRFISQRKLQTWCGYFVVALTVLPGLAFAQISASHAWVRPTVSGQQSTGAFMKISAQRGAKLLAASSVVAGIAEIHEMKMDGDIMRMRAVASLKVAPGQTIELKSGGYHLMLTDLTRQIKAGDEVVISLPM